MPEAKFGDLYDLLKIPVIVCRRDDDLTVAYLNAGARLLFAPSPEDGAAGHGALASLLRFRDGGECRRFLDALCGHGAVDRQDVDLVSHRGETVGARLFAAAARLDGAEYYTIYVAERPGRGAESGDLSALVNRLLRVARTTADFDAAIRSILHQAGEHARAGGPRIFEDISEEIARSRRGREILQTVTDNLEDLVYISDLDTYELKFISKSLARAIRKPVEEIVGQTCWRVLHRGQNGPCAFCPLPRLKDRAPGDNASYVWELHNSVTGKWYMVKDNIVDWMDGKRAHLGTFADITYRKQYEERLKRFAATDAMTDVYNRKWGTGKLEDLYRAAEGDRALQTLCFIDIDDLKRVNDRFGHAAGDEMIVNTIRTIFSCIRKEDFITRWGGDEFVLFLDCPVASARKVMEKIDFAIDHFNSTGDKPYTLSISYGLISFSAPFPSLDSLIDEADRLMYENKMEKRGGRPSETP